MSTGITIILMAKYPAPGQTKTRLTEGNRLTQTQAARIARVMLRAQYVRLRQFAGTCGGRLVVAVSPDEAAPVLQQDLGGKADSSPVVFRPQGTGTLGDRMLRAWQDSTTDAVTFFGMDSPDIPLEHFRRLRDSIHDHDLVIGPTPDGGYWTIGGTEPQPGVCRDIPWGTNLVYAKTMALAAKSGLSVGVLPEWHDVDRPDDVEALIRRMEQLSDRDRADVALAQLSSDLQEIGGSSIFAARDSTLV